MAIPIFLTPQHDLRDVLAAVNADEDVGWIGLNEHTR
jgi:hypothetical protein